MKASEVQEGDVLTYIPGGISLKVVEVDPDYFIPEYLLVEDEDGDVIHVVEDGYTDLGLELA